MFDRCLVPLDPVSPLKEEAHVKTERNLSHVATVQAQNQQKKEAITDSSIESLEVACPGQQVDFKFLATTLKKLVSVLFSHQFCSTLSQRPYDTSERGRKEGVSL